MTRILARFAILLVLLAGVPAQAQTGLTVVTCQEIGGSSSFLLQLNHDRRVMTQVTGTGETIVLDTQRWDENIIVAVGPVSGQRYSLNRHSGQLVTVNSMRDTYEWGCRPSKPIM